MEEREASPWPSVTESEKRRPFPLLESRGVSRLVVLLILAIVLLLIPILWGVWKEFRADVERKECAIALQSAQRKLDDEFLLNPGMTDDQAEEAATSEIRSLDTTCPGGGHYRIFKRIEGDGYEIYCDLHGRIPD